MIRFFRSPSNPSDKELYDFLFQSFKFKPINLELYRKAFRHKSVVAKSNNPSLESNERLEFLGDAVLDIVVAEFIYQKFPAKTEGELTKLKARIVSRASLNKIAKKLNLLEQIKLKQTEQLHGGSIPGNTIEALIGAIFLDFGYEKTRATVVNEILKKHLDLSKLESTDTDYKSRIMIWAQKQHATINFTTAQIQSTDTKPIYKAQLLIDGKQVGEGEGKSKRSAEQAAAKQALEILY